jgi:hypothetical protein
MAISKTTAGHRVLKERSAGLSPRQRAALILIDGQRSLDDVLAATSPGGVTRGDIERLLHMGLVADEPGDSYPVPLFDQLASAPAGRERYVQAYQLATELIGALGPRASQLTLAVEAAGSLQELRALAPKIRAAVGPARFARLEAALRPA